MTPEHPAEPDQPRRSLWWLPRGPSAKPATDTWHSFAEHRKKTTELLSAGPGIGFSRLCVLGAGACNDLDLAALLASHQELHLVDLKPQSLAGGVTRQLLSNNPAVHCHGGVDVTGSIASMRHWSPATIVTDSDLVACVEKPVRLVPALLPGPFQTVASTCLLSQLIGNLMRLVGEEHEQFQPLFQAIRLGHLRLLTELLSPGGTGVLITDVVSSETYPLLDTVAEQSLSLVLARLINMRNFFHGVNPSVILSLFRTDPMLRSQIAETQLTAPWRWRTGTRTYGVCAVTMRKTAR